MSLREYPNISMLNHTFEQEKKVTLAAVLQFRQVSQLQSHH